MIDFLKWGLGYKSPRWISGILWFLVLFMAGGFIILLLIISIVRPVLGLMITALLISIFVHYAFQIYKNEEENK